MTDSTPPAPPDDVGDGADLGHLDPGPAPWLEAALEADVEIDPATMERHIATALDEFGRAEFGRADSEVPGSPTAPVPGRSASPGRARWLTVAAAVIVTLGAAAAIAGIVASPGSDRVDSVAEKSATANASKADEDAGRSSVDASTAPGSGLDDRARAATDASGVAPTADLGEFANDDDLRRAIASIAGASATAQSETSPGAGDAAPPTAPAVPRAPTSEERALDAPTLACPPPDEVASGWKVLSATVAGTRVLVVVSPDTDPDAVRVVVYDAATCTIRPRRDGAALSDATNATSPTRHVGSRPMSESTPPTSPPTSPVPEAPSAAVPSSRTGDGQGPVPSGAAVNGTEPDWTDQVTDLIVDVVDRVRDRTTGPILKVARGVVYGIVAVVVAFPVFIIGTIFLGRLLELIPGPIWIPYAVLGVILVITGLILWKKRRPFDA